MTGMTDSREIKHEVRWRFDFAQVQYDAMVAAWPDPELRTPHQRELVLRQFYVLGFLRRVVEGEIEATPAALAEMEKLTAGIR